GEQTTRLNPQKQKVARVLFAAAQPLVDFSINWNSYQQKRQAVLQKWQERVTKDAMKFGKAIDEYRKKKGRFPEPDEVVTELLDEKLLIRADVTDPLGTPYTVRTRHNLRDFVAGFLFISAGIDKQLNTEDDIRLSVYPGGYVGSAFGRMVPRRVRGRMLDEFEEIGPVGPQGPPGPMMPMATGAVAMNRAVDKLEAIAEAQKFLSDSTTSAAKSAPAEEPVRVRQFFPETLFVNPNVLTDERGNAVVSLDMADSITSWRLTTLASSAQGGLGSTTSPLRVFQDFFVDIDLPVSLTQNDEVSIPVAVYNYLPQAQMVRLKLETEDESWFEMASGETAERTVDMDANQVGVVYYTLRVKEIGNHKLQVTARGAKLSDAIARTIEVLPDGQEIWQTHNDRLQGDVGKTMMIPAGAIDGGSNILVRIYPGAFSQVVDGLDKILRMPFG
ncbi:MAG: hypothetical protein M3347_10820, partial [Armatimonadota bacterium]|nr:hypothetical protein [Armatimonadota bacterium]